MARQLDTEAATHIRGLALEELVRALVTGADLETVREIAVVVVACDRRLATLSDVGAPPTLRRRQQIAGEALVPPVDHQLRGVRRSSEHRGSGRGADVRIAPKRPARP